MLRFGPTILYARWQHILHEFVSARIPCRLVCSCGDCLLNSVPQVLQLRTQSVAQGLNNLYVGTDCLCEVLSGQTPGGSAVLAAWARCPCHIPSLPAPLSPLPLPFCPPHPFVPLAALSPRSFVPPMQLCPPPPHSFGPHGLCHLLCMVSNYGRVPGAWQASWLPEFRSFMFLCLQMKHMLLGTSHCSCLEHCFLLLFAGGRVFLRHHPVRDHRARRGGPGPAPAHRQLRRRLRRLQQNGRRLSPQLPQFGVQLPPGVSSNECGGQIRRKQQFQVFEPLAASCRGHKSSSLISVSWMKVLVAFRARFILIADRLQEASVVRGAGAESGGDQAALADGDRARRHFQPQHRARRRAQQNDPRENTR